MGQLAAEYGHESPTSGTQYLVADTLGSTRLVMGSPGNERHDYLPYGGELTGGVRTVALGYGGDTLDLKFTGKKRDSETGLDYFGARYFSAAQGRFTSPDVPLVDQNPLDPQSWNFYSYGRNNPLTNIDPSGRSWVTTTTPDGKESQGDDGDGKGCEAAGVAPTKDQQPPPEDDVSDIKPNPNSTGDPNNPNIQGNTATARAESFSLPAVYRDVRDYMRNSPFPITVAFGVGLPVTANSVGPQISVAIIPKTRQICLSGGVYVTTPGSDFLNVTAGLLVHGPVDRAADVVSSFGVGGTLQKSYRGGYQVSSSSSGTLGGPSVGSLGVSASAGYGACFTVGR